MYRILICLQGVLDEKTIESAVSFKKIVFSRNYKVDVIFLAWKTSNFINKSNEIKIIYLEDTASTFTKDSERLINLNRQIKTTAFLLDKFKNKYDYILKLRSDILVVDSFKFKKEFLKAIKIPKIWILNISTFSPRILKPVSLEYHFSDWFIGGTPNRLSQFLKLEEVDESKLIENTPFFYKNNIFWREAQNEQLIWSSGWSKETNKKANLKISNRKIKKKSFEICFESAKYLNRHFYLSPFLFSGLKSIKHISSTILWYKNSYSINNLNFLETYLINNGYLFLAVLYIPFLRYLILSSKKLFKKSRKLRF